MPILCYGPMKRSQLYLTFKNANDSKVHLNTCTAEIKHWMILNKLVLHDAKTEVIHFRSQFRKCDPLQSFSVGNNEITPTAPNENLGVYFDQNCNLFTQASRICQSGCFALHRVSVVPFFFQGSPQTLTHDYVKSTRSSSFSLLLRSGVVLNSIEFLIHIVFLTL